MTRRINCTGVFRKVNAKYHVDLLRFCLIGLKEKEKENDDALVVQFTH